MAVLNWFKWSARQWCLFLPFAAALIIVLPRDLTLPLDKWLLWLTGFLILLYTVETQGLRFEMIRQNEVTVEPVLIASMRNKEIQRVAPTATEVILLRNIGRGPALYISAEGALLTRELGADWFSTTIGTIDLIEPGGEVIILPVLPPTPEAPTTSKVREKGDPSVTVRVKYEDLGGAKRESLIMFGDGVPKLIKHRRIG